MMSQQVPQSSTLNLSVNMKLSNYLNQYKQPVGQSMPEWSGRPRPERRAIEGRYCYLEALHPRHARELYEAYGVASDGRDWTYMVMGPFSDQIAFEEYINKAAASEDPLHYAVIDRTSGKAVGTLALMRMDPANGVVEVGSVMFSPLLKRTPFSTEAQFLLMKYVFDELGYRRYEWKCDSFNEPSRKTAARLGFQFEGTFRQHMLYKGRSRDTSWFSIVDSEWPAIRSALERWLSPSNFDADGIQRRSLTELREPATV